MTLFEAGDGRMAIHTMNAELSWYNDLIRGRDGRMAIQKTQGDNRFIFGISRKRQ